MKVTAYTCKTIKELQKVCEALDFFGIGYTKLIDEKNDQFVVVCNYHF